MHDLSIEKLIIQNLIINETFTRQVLPFLQDDYFEEQNNMIIYSSIQQYFKVSEILPEKNILLLEIKEHKKSNQQNFKEIKDFIDESYSCQPTSDLKWLLEQTEQWCKDRSMYLSIVKAIAIYDGSDKSMAPHAIPDMIKDSLAISFETKIGSDWIDDAEGRYDRYKVPENKIAFDLETLNDITYGGVTKKSLSLILAGVHVGKTMSLVHFSAGYARLGYNVLYLSMEMGEDEIMQRIDANMLKTPMHIIKEIEKEKFISRIHHLKRRGYGKIKVIQYPTSVAHTGHFKNALNELKMKLNWIPDIVMVDYVGIVASSRIKMGSTNSHFYLKSVAEELRAMAIEYNVAVWSVMQLTRGGMGSSDVEMTDVAECVSLMTKVLKKTENDYVSSLITDLQIGDVIKGYKKDVVVKRIFPVKKKQAIRIATKSGKQIVCSMDHKIPTQKGLVCYNNGLGVGDQVVVI